MQPDSIAISKADLIKVQAEVCHCYNYGYVGLRISEVLHLKRVDVNTAASQIRVADGKGEKQRALSYKNFVVSNLQKLCYNTRLYQTLYAYTAERS